VRCYLTVVDRPGDGKLVSAKQLNAAIAAATGGGVWDRVKYHMESLHKGSRRWSDMAKPDEVRQFKAGGVMGPRGSVLRLCLLEDAVQVAMKHLPVLQSWSARLKSEQKVTAALLQRHLRKAHGHQHHHHHHHRRDNDGNNKRHHDKLHGKLSRRETFGQEVLVEEQAEKHQAEKQQAEKHHDELGRTAFEQEVLVEEQAEKDTTGVQVTVEQREMQRPIGSQEWCLQAVELAANIPELVEPTRRSNFLKVAKAVIGGEAAPKRSGGPAQVCRNEHLVKTGFFVDHSVDGRNRVKLASVPQLARALAVANTLTASA